MLAQSIRASVLLTFLLPAVAFAAPEAGPSARAGRPRTRSLALISVSRGEGFTELQVATIEEVMLSALSTVGGFKVIGRSDINALLSLEATKQRAGCDVDAACMVEIAGALGVDFVAAANVGRLGNQTVISLKVLDVRSAVVVARAQEMVDSDSALASATRSIANQVGNAVQGFLNPEAVKTPGISAGRGIGIGTIVLGALALAAGTGLGVVAAQQEAHLRSTKQTGGQVLQQVNSANSQALDADILFGVGGGLGIAGITLTVVF